MKIVAWRKINKNFVMPIGLMFALAIIIGLWSSNYLLQAKVDRSTAMQVTKNIVVEQDLAINTLDFFTEYRLERDKIRSERSDFLRESIKDAKNDESRVRAQDIVLKMITEKQKETEMESLIKARGFADSLVFIRENSVSAVIKANSLSREEVVQVADVISRVSGVKVEDISISAKP